MLFRLGRHRALAACMPVILGVVALAGMPSATAATPTVGNAISTTSLAAVGGPNAAGLAGALVDTATAISISNAKYTGNPNAAGIVTITDPSIVSFNKGVILSSGDIANVIGPNKSDGITGDMGTGQDDSLTALIANTQTVNPLTYDAAVLEFDITAPSSDVYFTYVFGSDEYLEWVNLYNDVFAFWINGVNCATVTDAITATSHPVTIDTINDQVNSGAYRDNSYSAPPANPLNIEMDGLSVELVCHAVVTPNKPAHVKLAIADTSDQILDSVVMLKAGTLSTTKPESCNNKVDDDGDNAIDMDDNYCTSTTTTPTASSGKLSGSGSNYLPAAFTGNEGDTLALDASAIDWYPASGTTYTHWEVLPINGTKGTCTITSPDLWLHTVLDAAAPAGLRAAVATATCTTEGEYVARVAGYESYGATTNDTGGTDIDFFVHNAPPVVEPITTAVSGAQGTASAFVYDLGANDTVTCSVAWGDGSKSAGVIDSATDLCSATHTYTLAGTYLVALTGKDNQGASAAAADTLTIAPFAQPPSVTGNPANASIVAGASAAFHASATGSPTPGIQWQSMPSGGSWSSINGATGETYTLSGTLLADNGKQFRAVFTNGSGTATSAAATLTVTSPVTLASFAPTSGGKGTSVTITGVGLDKVTAVTFNGAAAPLLIASSKTLFTAVPATATTGKIVLTYAGGTASSGTNFTFSSTAKLPTISAFTPTSAAVGAQVKITGTNLIGTTALKFGTIAAAFTVDSPTQITASVPTGAITAKLAVTTAGGTGSSASSFTVTVVKVNSVLTYTGALTATKNTSFSLQATLKTAGGAALASKSVKFTFNAKTYTATTNASGVASVAVTAPKTAANYPVSAAFAGDTTTNASNSPSATVAVS